MFAIKKMRERAGLSQQDTASALGITLRRYGNWEREDREINLRDAIRLADLFGCTLDELAGRPWPTEGLSPDERDLLDAYRGTDARGREAINAIASVSSGVAADRDRPDEGAMSA